jgi:hypothetical protein
MLVALAGRGVAARGLATLAPGAKVGVVYVENAGWRAPQSREQ